eukprot:m51a1_g11044 putative potassium transporter (600) ;mRNA; f:453297-455504
MGGVEDVSLDLCRLGILSCAAWGIAKVVKSATGLPLVTSYVGVGIAVGPCALAFFGSDAPQNLAFVSNVALSFIGFIAASEFYLKDIAKPKSIAIATARGVVVTYAAVLPLVLGLGRWLPWFRTLATPDLVCAALLLSCIAVVRAPSVAVAVANETRASGPFTTTVLQVIMVLDAAVIVLWAATNSLCRCIVKGSFSAVDLANVGIEFALTFASGLVQAGLIRLLFGFRPFRIRLRRSWRYRVRLLLRGSALCAIGYAPFGALLLAKRVHLASGLALSLDGLLSSMIGGFVIVNYTDKRHQFARVLSAIVPYLFVLLFVITGVGLNIFVFKHCWALVPVIFFARIAALVVAEVTKFRSRFPLRSRALFWMAYVTQAGVGVSLAGQLVGQYPFAEYLYTLVMGVIVVNTLVGPFLFKWAISIFGEAHPGRSGARRIVIAGVDKPSLVTASHLRANGWSVVLADTSERRLEMARDYFGLSLVAEASATVKLSLLDDISKAALEEAEVAVDDTLICAMADDGDNYRMAQAALGRGMGSVVVKIADRGSAGRFADLRVLVIDRDTDIVDCSSAVCELDPVLSQLRVVINESDPLIPRRQHTDA